MGSDGALSVGATEVWWPPYVEGPVKAALEVEPLTMLG
jgi:hypothetical protein